jgi:cathepsin C
MRGFWLLSLAAADLPVHCLRHQVVGDWEFRLGPPTPQRTSCGHQRPDSEASNPQPSSFASAAATTVKVSLSDPNGARVTDGAGMSLLDMSSQTGAWTMIYDEGFEVKAAGATFFAFSRYDLFQKDGHKVNISHCGETMVGWYHNDARNSWGCFVGAKVTQGQGHTMMLASFVPGAPQKSLGYDMPLDYGWHSNVASRLNMLQTGWKATVYHKFVGKTPRELNKMMGIRRTTPISAMVGANANKKHASFLALSSTTTTNGLKRREYDRDLQRVEESLPDSLDWRTHNSQNFLEPVMDQGDCGSCYVVSTMRMLSARNKIRLAQPDALPFSISFPLYCSEYNQGCDGGYAFLTSKWSEDVGLIPATCARYTSSGQCEITCSEEEMGEKLRATNHHYVGGYYGGATAAEIMRELQNGPVVVSLEPKSDLMYYQGGIYESTPDEVHQEWERVDHAVLLVGYGEEAGHKYWILQNSWGPDWGENGYFRMARGINDSGVESIAVAADVIADDSSTGVSNFLQGQAGATPSQQ